MKMNKISALALGLLASAALFTGCSKDLETSSVTGLVGTGTIKGYVYVDFDKTNHDTLETKAGVTVRAYYSSSELAYKADPNAMNVKKVVTATTGADGSYSLTIPATDKGTVVSLEVGMVESNNEIRVTKYVGTTFTKTTVIIAKAYFDQKSLGDVTVKKDVTTMAPTCEMKSYTEITTAR